MACASWRFSLNTYDAATWLTSRVFWRRGPVPR
jgi:hypothetical protein